MDLKQEERYYHPNQLNKWFALSSIVFLISIIATFGDDYDREWKKHQRIFRQLEVQYAKADLEEIDVDTERAELEAELDTANSALDKQQSALDTLDAAIVIAHGGTYWADMRYQASVAQLDAVRYKLEHTIETGGNVGRARAIYDKNAAEAASNRVDAESYQTIEKEIIAERDAIQSEVKTAEKALSSLLTDVAILERKLTLLDPESMTTANRIGTVIRDLPFLDFLAPSLRVKQIVIDDIRDDVIFTTVPRVDRCTSCHLGIDIPAFKDAPQPYTTHPDLGLYLKSASPHPINDFGCTSCHLGRGRGTSFASSGHMPDTPEQANEWEEIYGWEALQHWDEKMYPAKYSQAGCLKCHYTEPIIEGAEQLSLGLSLIEKAACYGCHLLERFESWERRGPNLAYVGEKITEDFAFKWIRNPSSFRHNTWMPSFFNQTNTQHPEAILRTDTEIHGIVRYLFANSSKVEYEFPGRIGNASKGEELFNAVGCRGCHVVEPDPEPVDITLDRMFQRHGPNLIGMGSKTSAQWIFNWIKDPTFYNPISRMPNLRLTDSEAADVTAYLLSMRESEFEAAEVPLLNEAELMDIAVGWLAKSNTLVEATRQIEAMTLDQRLEYVGEKSILHYGCFSCHNLPGFENARPIGTPLTFEGSKPVHNLDFGSVHEIGETNYNWFEAKLANPRIFDRDKIKPHDALLRMPNFMFTQNEVEALTTALMGLVKSDVLPTRLANQDVSSQLAQTGLEIVKDFNCQGCHIINGFGGQIAGIIGDPALSPPNLNTEGDKVQPDWLYSFFKAPTTIRPNLDVRMPTYPFDDEQWNAIIRGFQGLDDVQISFEEPHVVDKTTSTFAVGVFLASADVGDCGKCHILGSINPTGERKDWAPNLDLAAARLRPDWVVRWLDNPITIMPGTKMPQPYLPEKEDVDFEGAEEYFPKPVIEMAGHREALLNALRDYVYSFEK